MGVADGRFKSVLKDLNEKLTWKNSTEAARKDAGVCIIVLCKVPKCKSRPNSEV